MVNLDLSCYNAVVQYCSMLWVCLGKEIISACLLCQWLWMVRVSHPCRSPDQPKLGLSHSSAEPCRVRMAYVRVNSQIQKVILCYNTWKANQSSLLQLVTPPNLHSTLRHSSGIYQHVM